MEEILILFVIIEAFNIVTSSIRFIQYGIIKSSFNHFRVHKALRDGKERPGTKVIRCVCNLAKIEN